MTLEYTVQTITYIQPDPLEENFQNIYEIFQLIFYNSHYQNFKGNIGL